MITDAFGFDPTPTGLIGFSKGFVVTLTRTRILLKTQHKILFIHSAVTLTAFI